MINHSSPYGQILRFSPNLYFSLSDEKLAEIEQNCANIERDVITISGNPQNNIIVSDDDIDLDIDL